MHHLCHFWVGFHALSFLGYENYFCLSSIKSVGLVWQAVRLLEDSFIILRLGFKSCQGEFRILLILNWFSSKVKWFWNLYCMPCVFNKNCPQYLGVTIIYFLALCELLMFFSLQLTTHCLPGLLEEFHSNTSWLGF